MAKCQSRIDRSTGLAQADEFDGRGRRDREPCANARLAGGAVELPVDPAALRIGTRVDGDPAVRVLGAGAEIAQPGAQGGAPVGEHGGVEPDTVAPGRFPTSFTCCAVGSMAGWSASTSRARASMDRAPGELPPVDGLEGEPDIAFHDSLHAAARMVVVRVEAQRLAVEGVGADFLGCGQPVRLECQARPAPAGVRRRAEVPAPVSAAARAPATARAVAVRLCRRRAPRDRCRQRRKGVGIRRPT